jgi:hypothetical protein
LVEIIMAISRGPTYRNEDGSFLDAPTMVGHANHGDIFDPKFFGFGKNFEE